MDYLKGYNFMVYIGQTRAAFAKVSGFEQTMESETFTEGGSNSRVYTLSKRVSSQSSAVFERGVAVSRKQDLNFAGGDYISDGISIYLLDGSGKVQQEYNLEGCVIQKLTLTDLDAQRSEILIERLEVSYETFSRA